MHLVLQSNISIVVLSINCSLAAPLLVSRICVSGPASLKQRLQEAAYDSEDIDLRLDTFYQYDELLPSVHDVLNWTEASGYKLEHMDNSSITISGNF
jgi:hypothetical protein